MSRIVKDHPCPSCQSIGRDVTGNHLIEFDNGGFYCNRCEYTIAPDGTVTNAGYLDIPVGVYKGEQENEMLTFEEVEKLPIKPLKARGIDKDVAEYCGVRTFVDQTTGEDAGYCYPITVKGKVESYRIRELPKKFSNVNKNGSLKGKKVELFGQSICQQKGKKILVVGGQDDWLASFQMLYRSYPKFKPNVVSVTHGENPKSVADNLDFLLGYEEVIICMDQDEVGRKAARDIAMLVGPKAKVMTISEKDPNKMLSEGKHKEFVNAFFSATPIRPEGIVVGGDLNLEDIKKVPTVGYDTPYPIFNKMTGGLRKGELITVTGASGQGKTSLCRELAYDLRARHGLKIGNIFLEELLSKTVQGYIAIDNDIPLNKLRSDPTILTEEQWEVSYDKLIKEGWVAYDHFGSMPTDELMERLRHMVYGEGVDFVILDHISLIVGGQKNDNDVKALELAMTELATFVTESGAGLINVSHLSRNRNKASFNEGGAVSLTDLKGSSALEQLSFTVLAYERNQQDEENNNLGNIRILKCRETGATGKADDCEYNPETGRLLAIQPDMVEF